MIQEFLQHPPFRMVFMSLIALFIYLAFILVYQYIYPKGKIPYVLLLLGFSTLPVVSVFREGIYESGDLTLHVARFMDFYKSLSEGVFIPRWASELNATYGYPLFEFIYPFPYYLASIFRVVGLTFLDSIKVVLITTYILSGVAMFYWLKTHMEEKHAFLGGIFYLFAPFHLIDLHFRNALGEMTAFVFIPLSLYLIDQSTIKKTFLWVFLTGISIALLILSHPAISMYGFDVIFLYITFVIKVKTREKVKLFVGPLLGLSFSAFYWLTLFLEKKYVYYPVMNNTLVFPNFHEYFYTPWRFGFLFQGPFGELAMVLGYTHWVIVLLSIYFFLFKKIKNRFLSFFTILFLGAFFLLQEISKPLWENIFLLKSTYLPYRLLSISMFATSAMAAFCMKYLKNKFLYYLLICLVIMTTILNWGNRRNIPEINDEQIAATLPLASAAGECFMPGISITKSEDSCFDTIPNSHIEVVAGEAEINAQERKTLVHSYIIDANEESVIKENTHYFPGWNIFVDGRQKEIVPDNGVMTFTVDKGNHNVELVFQDTSVRKYATAISVFAFLVSGALLLYTL